MSEQAHHPRQVLHLIHGLTVGGAEVDLLQKCKVLAQQYGYEFTVVCLMRRGELAPQLEALGVTVVGPLMRQRYDVGAGLALRRLLRTHPARILHTHLAAANLIGWLVNRTRRPPARKILLAGEHAMAERWPGPVLWLDRRMARTAPILVPTQATRASYIARGVPAGALHVLPDSVDVSRFEQIDAGAARTRIRRELGLADDEFVVGTVCRLEPVKNLPALIECVADLPVRLLIAGDGSERQHLSELIAAQGLAGKVRLLGNRGDIPELLAALDLFVLPSRSETFGIVVAEALLMQTPVIAARVGGIPDITGNGAYAHLVMPDDNAALRAAIAAAIAQPAALREQARAGRAFIRRTFAADVAAAQLHEMYEAILRSAPYS